MSSESAHDIVCFWILPLSKSSMGLFITTGKTSVRRVRQAICRWIFFIFEINCINSYFRLCPSWTGVLIVVSMAATWLFAVALVRNPATRRICLKDARNLSRLCWMFCALWEAALWYYDGEFVETWSGKCAAATS
ncbi:hypothetical protein F4604DRAFT_1762303 [Suillus subluteus]|nr:hypothetical protein F4604DRAFT_1762303 [Suillus subluteus]